MMPASIPDDGETERRLEDSAESRLTALARNLIDTVGVEGAIRYCSSLGWRGVLREVEALHHQSAKAD